MSSEFMPMALDSLARELDTTTWLFSMSKEDDEHGF